MSLLIRAYRTTCATSKCKHSHSLSFRSYAYENNHSTAASSWWFHSDFNELFTAGAVSLSGPFSCSLTAATIIMSACVRARSDSFSVRQGAAISPAHSAAGAAAAAVVVIIVGETGIGLRRTQIERRVGLLPPLLLWLPQRRLWRIARLVSLS